jgi:hypothetical protein
MLDSINLLKQRDIRNFCGLGLEPQTKPLLLPLPDAG